jgi:Flp pilus assembly protein TadG
MNRSLRSDRRGIAAVEFAIVLPVLLLVVLATVDVVSLVRASWRMERAAGELGNVIAQLDVITDADFPVLFDVADRIAAPYELTGLAGAVIVTGIAGGENGATIAWQRRAGAGLFSSRIGGTGTASLPAGFVLPAGQSAIAVETYVQSRPWVLAAPFLGGATRTLSGFGLFRPRLATLGSIDP